MLKIKNKISENLLKDYQESAFKYLRISSNNKTKETGLLEDVLIKENYKNISKRIVFSKNVIRQKFKDKEKQQSLWDYFRRSRIGIFEKIYKELKIKICPYCGRNYIEVIKLKVDNKEKEVVPCLDHFLPKNRYPEYTLSLYNLIPSCNFCNSVLKGKEVNRKKEEILNPYKEGYEDFVKFSLGSNCKEDFNNIILLLTSGNISIEKSGLKILLVTNDKALANKKGSNVFIEKCKKQIKFFTWKKYTIRNIKKMH